MLIKSLIKRTAGTKITLGAITYHFRPDADGNHVAEVEDHSHIATLLSIKEGFRPADGSIVAADVSVPQIDGFYFIVRGPQDAQAFAHWASCIPEMSDFIDEPVLLIDKIALGEANLGGYELASLPDAIGEMFNQIDLDTSADALAAGPLASGPSPRTPADNSILPQDQSQVGDGAAAGDRAGLSPGDGGADAAGGVGADTPPPPPPSEDGPLDREELARAYAEIHGHRPNGKWSAERIAEVLRDIQE